MAGVVAEAAGTPGSISAEMLDIAFHAFASGMHSVALTSAAIMFGAAALILARLRHLRPVGAAQTAESTARP